MFLKEFKELADTEQDFEHEGRFLLVDYFRALAVLAS